MPREPGLWCVDAGKRGDVDAHQVEKAKQHLQELLKDPYYLEAMVWLVRRGDLREILNDKGGNLPPQGKLAAKYQRPSKVRIKRPRGAQKAARLDNYRTLLRAYDLKQPNMAMIALVRKLLRELEPAARDRTIEGAAEKIAEKMRGIRRRSYKARD
ncbi:MAG: hypothetical protein AB1649_31960 [Chloroflexota bacterium]